MTNEPYVGPSGPVFTFHGSSEEGAQLAFFGLESVELRERRAIRASKTYHLVLWLPVSIYHAYHIPKGDALFGPKN